MKILVLDEEFPYPLNTGKRLRSFNILKRLASNHQLRYLACGIHDSESFRALKQSGMNPVAVSSQTPKKSGIMFYARLFANLFSRYPYIVTSHYSAKFRSAFSAQLTDFQPDLIICEWTPYTVFVKDIHSAIKIMVAHNIESRIWQRYYENEGNPLRKWYIGKQWVKVAAFERATTVWVDGITAVSDKEAIELRSMGGNIPIEVIDNGVDLDYFQPGRPYQTQMRKLVFTGSMDWRPNQDAALYFVNELLPRIHRKYPDVEITFVGRNPPRHIMALNNMNRVTVTGTVEDVRPYIQEAAVYVVPLRIGGGSRLKILEALAMKKPVVSTSMGAEGLDVDDGRNILIADSPEQFAKNVGKLLDDPTFGHELAEDGRKLVEKRYGWNRLALKLDRFLISLVNKA